MSRTIISDPKSANIIAANDISTEIKEYLEVVSTSYNDDGTIITNTLRITAGDNTLYRLYYYSRAVGKIHTVICKVIKTYTDMICIAWFKQLDPNGICPCAHKDILINYLDLVQETVMFSDIFSIEEYEEPKPIPPKPIKPKEVTKVSILGISSEIINSVIVRLRFYEDGCCEVTDTTIVDMAVGNKYSVFYLDHHDHTMYEIEGTLKSISIEQSFGDEPPNQGFVRQEQSSIQSCNYHDGIGMYNLAYDRSDDTTVYDPDHFFELAKSNPEKILFVFDTSTDFNSTFDKVWLKDIRSVSVMEEGDIDIVEPDEDENIDEGFTVIPPGFVCPEKCPTGWGGIDHDCGCDHCHPNLPPIIINPGCDHDHHHHYHDKPGCGFPPPPPPPTICEIDVGDISFISHMDENAKFIMKNPDGTRVNLTLRELLEAYASYSGIMCMPDDDTSSD